MANLERLRREASDGRYRWRLGSPELPLFHRASIPRSAPARVSALLAGLFTDAEPQWAPVEHDKSLLLDFRPQMDAILRVTSWEDGLRTLRLVEGRWVEEWHDWQLAFVGESRGRDVHPANGVALTVPKEAADLAVAAGGYEITALRLLRWHRQAWDFARTAPNLFWLLCAHLGARNEPPSANGALFETPRTVLLRMCTGKPASGAAVRFVERFQPYNQSQYELHLLRTSVRPDVVQLMRWCPRFGPNALRHAAQAADDPPLFLPDALRLCGGEIPGVGGGVAQDDAPVRDAYQLYDDAVEVARALGRDADDAEAILRHAPSVKKLRAVHDAWAARLNADFPERARQRLRDAAPFAFSDEAPDEEELPESGLANTPDIKASRTVGDLRAEGYEMDNCAAAYVRRCRRADSFIFRVLRPSRATLEVHLCDGRPVLAQLKGLHNSEPSSETKMAVERWLGA